MALICLDGEGANGVSVRWVRAQRQEEGAALGVVGEDDVPEDEASGGLHSRDELRLEQLLEVERRGAVQRGLEDGLRDLLAELGERTRVVTHFCWRCGERARGAGAQS